MSRSVSASPDRELVSEILRSAAGWLSATRVGEVSPSFGVNERAMIRHAAKVLERGFRNASHSKPERRGGSGTLDQLDSRIVALLSAGNTYQGIANKLRVAYGTVHTRIKGLYRRFGVHSNLALVSLFHDFRPGLAAARSPSTPKTLAAHRTRRKARMARRR